MQYQQGSTKVLFLCPIISYIILHRSKNRYANDTIDKTDALSIRITTCIA